MKNKIHKYDFLVVGAGLIGSIAALALVQKKNKVLVIDKKNNTPIDNRTLAVNANSTDFLKKIGVWNNLKSNPQPINKIVIKDDISTHSLIFENEIEPMGNVIFNKELFKISRQKLENLKILKTNVNLETNEISPNKNILINGQKYLFKKIIFSIGKNVTTNKRHKSVIFDQQHFSYVGFFKHIKLHNDTAYEFFTSTGPLAVLPAPDINKNKSTFIYSSKKKINKIQLESLIKKKINKSHGKLTFDKSISKFPIVPHITKNNDNFIYIGDSLKSIHPVAGQGWNLGIKDIQTLCKLLDSHSIEAKNFNKIYYSRRILESTIYLTFTSTLNYLYESKISLNKRVIDLGFKILKNIKLVRNLFIKQAMGRVNLTD